MKQRCFTFLIASALALCLALGLAPARAADGDRTRDLAALAEVFGELHHIRRMCEPERENEIWRNRMKSLVALEQPTAALRRKLVAAFNEGFKNAQTRYPSCAADAVARAATRASDGEAIVARLSAQL